MDSFFTFFDTTRFFVELQAIALEYPTEVRLTEGTVVAGLGVAALIFFTISFLRRSLNAFVGAVVLFLATMLVFMGFSRLGFVPQDWQILLKTSFIAVVFLFVTSHVAMARENIIVGLVILLSILGLLGLGIAQIAGLGDFNIYSNVAICAAALLIFCFCLVTAFRGDRGAMLILPGVMVCCSALISMALQMQLLRQTWVLMVMPFALFAVGVFASVVASLFVGPQPAPRRRSRKRAGMTRRRDLNPPQPAFLDVGSVDLEQSDNDAASPGAHEAGAAREEAGLPALQTVEDMPHQASPLNEEGHDDEKNQVVASGNEEVDILSGEFHLDEIDIAELDRLERTSEAGFSQEKEDRQQAFEREEPTPLEKEEPVPPAYEEKTHIEKNNPHTHDTGAAVQLLNSAGPVGGKGLPPTSSNWLGGAVQMPIPWVWPLTHDTAAHAYSPEIHAFADIFGLHELSENPSVTQSTVNTGDITAPLSVRHAIAPPSLDSFDHDVIGGARPVKGSFESVLNLKTGGAVRVWGHRYINHNGIIAGISGFVERLPSSDAGLEELSSKQISLQSAEQDAEQEEMHPPVKKEKVLGILPAAPSVFTRAKSKKIAKHTDTEEHIFATAVKKGEICAHFQPIVSIETYEAVGFEALARWHRPGTAEPIAAADFIDVAISSGLEMDIAKAIIPQAAQELKLWCEEAPKAGRFVSFNVTARELVNSQLVDIVSEQMRRHNLPSGSIVIEVTESHVLDPKGDAPEIAKKLKEVGARLAIDDFGSGFANFNQLSAIDFDIVKTDKSLLTQAISDQRSEDVLRNLIIFAKKMSALVIMEGIETKEHAVIAEHIGSTLGQGFYFGRPEAIGGESSPSGEETGRLAGGDMSDYDALR